MKNLILLAFFIFVAATTSYSQSGDKEFRESCTSIMVGKKASMDGSVMTSHTCDGRYRSWMTIVPAQSPRIPFYANMLQTPQLFQLSGHKRYTTDAAVWIYRQTNKLASIRWEELRGKIEKPRDDFEARMFAEQSQIDSEAAKIFKENGKQAGMEFLAKYVNSFADETLTTWQKLGDELWYLFIRGL